MARLALVFILVGCAGKAADDSVPATGSGSTSPTVGDDATGTCPQPADGYTADALSAGGSAITCYYAPPEGYCRQITSSASNDMAVTDGKAAIGCADAVAVTDGNCPTDLAIGRCENWGPDEDRVYYECNKFDNILPQGVDVACGEAGGTWVPM